MRGRQFARVLYRRGFLRSEKKTANVSSLSRRERRVGALTEIKEFFSKDDWFLPFFLVDLVIINIFFASGFFVVSNNSTSAIVWL